MANLTVTVSESVTLNGAVRGNTNELTITGIESVFERIVSIPGGLDTTVVLTKNTVASSDGAIDIQNTKYIRITNLDSTNDVTLSLQIDNDNNDSVADHSCSILLEAGKTFMMGTPHEAVRVSDGSAAVLASLRDLESLLIDSGGNTVKVEIFAAGS